MRLVRDDAHEKLTRAKTMLNMARDTQAVELRLQHLNGVERILDQILSSMKNSDFSYTPTDDDEDLG